MDAKQTENNVLLALNWWRGKNYTEYYIPAVQLQHQDQVMLKEWVSGKEIPLCVRTSCSTTSSFSLLLSATHNRIARRQVGMTCNCVIFVWSQRK